MLAELTPQTIHNLKQDVPSTEAVHSFTSFMVTLKQNQEEQPLSVSISLHAALAIT